MQRHVRIAATACAVSLLVALTWVAAPAEAQREALDKRGTQEQPLIVKEAPSQETKEELRRDAIHSAERAEDVAYRAETDKQRRIVDRWTIRAAIATVLILTIQGVAFFVQAAQMRRSVREMKAATKVAQEAAESAKTSAEAAVNANTLSREALFAEHRPWIKFSASPLSLRLGQDGWEFRLDYQFQNIGSAPALNVQFSAEMMPHVLAAWRADEGDIDPAKMLAEATNVAAELERFSTQIVKAAASSPIFGALVFPQDKVKGGYQINRSDEPFSVGLTRRGYAGQLLLLAGVTYKSAADHSWHHTAVAFSLFPVGGQSAWIRPIGGKFEAGLGQLALQQQPLADSYAT